METMRLGRSDLEVSRVGLGCNNFGGRLDTRASAHRCDRSLLLPPSGWRDPLAETLGVLQELVDEGTVRFIGLSNVTATELEAAVATGTTVVAVQNRYSLLHRDDDADVLPFCREHVIGYVPYFPLESGLLTGKYRRGEPGPDGARLTGRPDRLTDELLERVETLEAVAQRQGRSLLELAIGGLASIPGIASVIAGATRPEQARANAEAGSWHATGDELDAITQAVG